MVSDFSLSGTGGKLELVSVPLPPSERNHASVASLLAPFWLSGSHSYKISTSSLPDATCSVEILALNTPIHEFFFVLFYCSWGSLDHCTIALSTLIQYTCHIQQHCRYLSITTDQGSRHLCDSIRFERFGKGRRIYKAVINGNGRQLPVNNLVHSQR